MKSYYLNNDVSAYKKSCCEHDSVEIRRMHKDSHPYLHGLQAWIDCLGVYNYVVCCNCTKVLRASANTEIYGTAQPKPQGEQA